MTRKRVAAPTPSGTVDEASLSLGRLSKTGLRPCPFCGSADLALITYGTEQKPLLIQCNGCGAAGPTQGQGQTDEQLRALWDVRAQGI